MITTVTLNAAIDKTYYLPQFQLGTVCRAEKVLAVPGGKGINVAKVLHQLGNNVSATGFVGGYNGRYISSELNKLGIQCDFVDVEGESRLCLNIIDESNHLSSEILEPGPLIIGPNIEEMKVRMRKLAQKSNIICMSGSLTTSMPSNTYAELIQIAKEEGAKVFLDTSGAALLEGLKAKPFLIKPNEDEIEVIIGKKLQNDNQLFESIQQLMSSGITCVVVSLGHRGSIAGYDGQLYRIKAPKIDALNAVGSGDAFIAGMASALTGDKTVTDAFRLATAVGSANAMSSQAGSVKLSDVERLLPLVEISTIRL